MLRHIAAALLLAFVAIAPAFAQAPPPVPVLADANRYQSYNITSSTASVNLNFPVFGDCTDISVKLNGAEMVSGTWTCVSIAGGSNLSILPLPITDMQVQFTPPLTTGFLEIAGKNHPRRLVQPTTPFINRYEFNETISGLTANQRELYQREPPLPTTSGYVLTSQGYGAPPAWTVPSGGSGTGSSGTVTSVGLSAPTGLAVSGSPITTSGTFALAWSGQIPQSSLPVLSANQILGSLTATSPSGVAVPSCSATNDALEWTSGTGFSCATIATSGSGTVTSVAASVPTGLTVTGSPITTGGTLAFAWSGAIPAAQVPSQLNAPLGVGAAPVASTNSDIFDGGDLTIGNNTYAINAYYAGGGWKSFSAGYGISISGAASGAVTLAASSASAAGAGDALTMDTVAAFSPTLATFYEPVLANVLGAIYPMAPPYDCAGNGSTDDTSCINSALSAAANSDIFWGPHLYGISSELTPTAPFTAVGTVAAWGVCKSGLKALTANMNLISVVAGTTFEHTCLEMNTGSVNASGAALIIPNVNQVKFLNGNIDGACIGVDLSGNSDVLSDSYISNDGGGSGCFGLRIGNLTDQANTIDARVTDTTIQGNQSNAPYADQYILDAGGLYEDNNDMLYGQYGTLIDPGCISSTGQQVNTPFFSNTVFGDTTSNIGLYFNTACSSAWVMGFNAVGGWVASNNGGNLVDIENGSSGVVDGINFVGTRLVNTHNAFWAIYANAGKNISFTSGFICGFGATGSGGSGGIDFQNTLGHDKANDNTIGRTCLNQTTSATGTYIGVAVVGTIPDTMAIGNDLTDNTTETSGTWTVSANNM